MRIKVHICSFGEKDLENILNQIGCENLINVLSYYNGCRVIYTVIYKEKTQ